MVTATASFKIKNTTLGEICELISGQHIKAKHYNTSGNGIGYLTGPSDFGDRNPTVTKWTPHPKVLAEPGDILITVKGNGVGKINILEGSTVAISRQLMAIRVSKANPQYVFAFLNTAFAHFQDQATGATIPGISRKQVLDFKIPLPPLEEQRRIAGILDLADGLRVKRREALAEVEGLAQAVFLEMFGDPRHLPSPKRELIELGKIHTGKTPPTSDPSNFDGTIPFVTPGDLNSNEPVKRTLSQKGASKSRFVRRGSALVCCIGATIGKMDIALQDCCFNQQINAVEWNLEKIDPRFGIEALRFFASTIACKGSSTTLPILNKSGFSKLEIPCPPLTLQQKFAERVEAIEKLKASQQRSLEEMEALFASLQSRAFKGEL